MLEQMFGYSWNRCLDILYSLFYDEWTPIIGYLYNFLLEDTLTIDSISSIY